MVNVKPKQLGKNVRMSFGKISFLMVWAMMKKLIMTRLKNLLRKISRSLLLQVQVHILELLTSSVCLRSLNL